MIHDKLSGTNTLPSFNILHMKHRQIQYGDEYFMHVCNKSIANYQIYSKAADAWRFLQAVDYYRNPQRGVSLTKAISRSDYSMNHLLLPTGNNIKIYAYCIMPDHYHLLLSSKSRAHVSQYINNVEN